MSSDQALDLTLGLGKSRMLSCVKLIFILQIKGKNLKNRDEYVLVDELLRELHLDIKLRHRIVIFHKEVLSVEERNDIRVAWNVESRNLFSLWPSLILTNHDWLTLVGQLW